MNFLNHKLAKIACFLSISAINLIFAQPGISAVSCEPGTISRYPNGSLKSCVLASDTKITMTNSGIGRLIFPCKAKNKIVFTEKSQFKSCKLSKDIKMKKGNSVRTCPKDYRVTVDTSNDGKNLSIQCQRY